MVTLEQHITSFVDRLRAAHGDNLHSVLIYGGAATREATSAATGARTLVVLERLRASDLRAAHDAVAEWVAIGNPPPVMMSTDEVHSSRDVFPIEFLDLADNRRILHGADPFEGLDVSPRHLRFQVEFELRGKLIRLRELYLVSSNDSDRIVRLLVESLGTFGKLFRFALRLVGEHGPRSRIEALRAGIRCFELDADPFDRILDVLTDDATIASEDVHRIFADYLAQIERVIDLVDKIPETDPA